MRRFGGGWAMADRPDGGARHRWPAWPRRAVRQASRRPVRRARTAHVRSWCAAAGRARPDRRAAAVAAMTSSRRWKPSSRAPYSPSPGAIYPMLQMLEEADLVAFTGRRQQAALLDHRAGAGLSRRAGGRSRQDSMRRSTRRRPKSAAWRWATRFAPCAGRCTAGCEAVH